MKVKKSRAYESKGIVCVRKSSNRVATKVKESCVLSFCDENHCQFVFEEFVGFVNGTKLQNIKK